MTRKSILSHEASTAAWETYQTSLLGSEGRRRCPEFELKKYCIGHLPAETSQSLRAAVESSPRELFKPDAIDPRAIATALDKQTVSRLNDEHIYLRFEGRQIWALHGLCEYLREPVATILGGNWRVLNVRAWITPTRAGINFGPNAWHIDGDAAGIFKIMVYLTEIGGDLGGLEIREKDGAETSITGPPGTWVCFYNSELMHRGVAPSRPDASRTAVELTISRWPKMVSRPILIGQNARHPYFPLLHGPESL